MRNVAQGVVKDEETHKGVCLGDGVTGVLAGTVLFSTPGKWRVYIAVYAVEGGDASDTVQVVFNGRPIETFHNDAKSGFPCEGGKCLDQKGLYIADAIITGDKLDYTVSWASSSPVKSKHMYIGAGEAIFVGHPAATPQSATAGPFPKNSKAVAMNAVDGKKSAKGKKTSDGEEKKAYVMATDPHLYVLDGLAVVFEQVQAEIRHPKSSTKPETRNLKAFIC
jgi:hypothetical protein